MFIILGAGGFLGYSLACELNRLHQAYATVSRSFQWEPFASEQRFLSPVSSVDTYSQCIADDSIVIYMAGSTDLVYAEANEVSDLEKHKDQMRSFFLPFMKVAVSHHGLSFLVLRELSMEMLMVFLLMKTSFCSRNLLMEEGMLC